MSEIESEELQRLRLDYIGRPLNREDLPNDPMSLFRVWFDQAVEAGNPQANAFALATATGEGVPSVRIVLLKSADRRGFSFYTNYESRKANELEANPVASLAFYWPELHRQVRIEGVVERTGEVEADEYFATRPRGAQIGAWASPQSRVLVGGRSELERLVERRAAELGEREVERPAHWGGFRLRARSFEFWQGRESRLHDRWVFRLGGRGDDWLVERLAP